MKTNSTICQKNYLIQYLSLKFIFFFCTFFGILGFSQVTSSGSTGDYTQNMDIALTYVNKTPITTGIL
jgi:hypothetical protein